MTSPLDFNTGLKSENHVRNNIFSPTLQCAATNRLLQESLACADTTLSLRYYVNRSVCRRVGALTHTYRCPCAKTLSEPTPHPHFPPPFFLSLSLFLLHHSTLPGAKPAFLFIRLSLSFCLSLSVFFIPCSFLPTPLPLLFNLLL